MTTSLTNETIKNYWDERARERLNTTATTDDVFLRELEIDTFIKTLRHLQLPNEAEILDVGCGDGYSTQRIAAGLPEYRFTGVDYSEGMIALAGQNARKAPQSAITFLVGDVLDLSQMRSGMPFDVVMTDRCLINLDSAEKQACAIGQIARRLRPGGYYVAIENFLEGQENLTRARGQMGLPEIPVRWHNRFFTEREWRQAAEPWFENIRFEEFSSSYYFATRVIYSAMCQMQGIEPDYRHEIHKLAVNLPVSGQFSPIRLVLMQRKTE